MAKSNLLHVCCSHCAAYTIEHWRRQGFETTAFFYNPNIHPESEYNNRLKAVEALSVEMEFPLVIGGYDSGSYFQSVTGDLGNRCKYCFDLRLSKTAKKAKEGGFSAFSTTLLISPHQKHEWIQEAGERAARETGVEFLYVDLRKRYSDSRHITKPMNLYRQQYCGCIYSKLERCFETRY